MTRLLLSCLLLFVSTHTTLSAGVFELKVDSFTSFTSVCRSPSRDCQMFFRVCLKHSQDVINPEPPCTYGNASTDVFGADSNSFPDLAHIRVPFHFKWPGSFSLILEAWKAASPGLESTENQNNLISRLATRRELSVGPAWAQDVHLGNQSELRYSYHVVCNQFYHGEACSAYCRPRNDPFGHFSCDADGRRVCQEGWSGEYCSDPICAAGCSEDHGSCRAPGECVCQQGWTGERCDECARHPGCLHGTCQQPWQCNCQEGWGGLYCNQDLNYCTNHRPCQNQASCTNTGQGSYTCACPSGFTGKNCEIQTNECDSGPCRNGGSCTDQLDGYACACPQGFYGKNCEVGGITCADEPCFNGGSCVQDGAGGYGCVCPLGFTGSNCEKRRDRCSSDPCANGGQCLDLGRRLLCRCPPGFAGVRCETNVDECASSPCRNAGTCVDGVNDFTCTCALGFTSKDCSRRSSPCDLFPCSNGGSCYAHFSGPVCQCPRGYMGARCEHPVAMATAKPPDEAPPTLIAAIALGLVTLALLLCASVHVLQHLLRGRALGSTSTSVKNDLESVNNRVTAGGGAGGGSPGRLLGSLKEKEFFLVPGGRLKVSNKDAAVAERGGACVFKNNMADCNLAKDEQQLSKSKFDFKTSDPSILVPPLSFVKDSLYQPVFILPEQMEPCVFATEV